MTITVDAVPGQPFKGRVSSISPGTGAQFSLIPAQNAAGNWVKVVQRVPVRITLDPGQDLSMLRAGMSVKDIDLFELNEAFAAVVLRYMQVLKMPHDKINVNGGAIAMGHPLGATGAMILGTLLDELERRNLATGLATLCVGGGMGTATIIERV